MNNHITPQPAHVTPADDMTCRDVAAFLMAYLDGELAVEPRRAFDDHLAQCSSCVRYVEHYRRTVAMAQATGQSIDDVPVPSGVLRAIRQARFHVA